MVLKTVWLQSWIVTTISLSTLVVISILLYCVCWKQKKIYPKFYVLDENGLTKNSVTKFARHSLSNLGLYRKLSIKKETTNEHIFTSKNLQFFKMPPDALESELHDSMDSLKSFENCTLQIVEHESQSSTKGDLHSCLSAESQCSFYSTHPALAKSTSKGTFVSIEMNNDTKPLID